MDGRLGNIVFCKHTVVLFIWFILVYLEGLKEQYCFIADMLQYNQVHLQNKKKKFYLKILTKQPRGVKFESFLNSNGLVVLKHYVVL